MGLRIKASGLELTPRLEQLCKEKLLQSFENRVCKGSFAYLTLDVELSKETRHHESGKIWKCEINLAFPHIQKTIYFAARDESIEAAIDTAKDELEREISAASVLKFARRMKENLRKNVFTK